MAQLIESSDRPANLSEILGVTAALGALVALPLAASAAGPALGPVSLALLTAAVFGVILAATELRRRSAAATAPAHEKTSPARSRFAPGARATGTPVRSRTGHIASGFHPARNVVEPTQTAAG